MGEVRTSGTGRKCKRVQSVHDEAHAVGGLAHMMTMRRRNVMLLAIAHLGTQIGLVVSLPVGDVGGHCCLVAMIAHDRRYN